MLVPSYVLALEYSTICPSFSAEPIHEVVFPSTTVPSRSFVSENALAVSFVVLPTSLELVSI